MRPVANFIELVDVERVAGYDPQAPFMAGLEFGQRGQAASITLDRDDLRARSQQRMGQSTRAGPDFINGRTVERTRNCGNAREQLPVENEILSERLRGLQPVPCDDLAQRLGRLAHALQDLR